MRPSWSEVFEQAAYCKPAPACRLRPRLFWQMDELGRGSKTVSGEQEEKSGNTNTPRVGPRWLVRHVSVDLLFRLFIWHSIGVEDLRQQGEPAWLQLRDFGYGQSDHSMGRSHLQFCPRCPIASAATTSATTTFPARTVDEAKNVNEQKQEKWSAF